MKYSKFNWKGGVSLVAKGTFLLLGGLYFYGFAAPDIITGADQLDLYLPALQNKRVGVITNHSGLIYESGKYVHLVDKLLEKGISLKKIFTPEHGFRGDGDAGQHIESATHAKTGLPIISLYGKNKKPGAGQLSDIDILVFDLQDVGARFYTYISTLHYVLEAAAESQKPLIVLDRPNPNGHYVDGPVLEPSFDSFVGLHPVPVVYGMTIGEYALMINGEGWLKNHISCDLTVIPLKNYTHQKKVRLPAPPSPNLPNEHAVNLYPSLCFFEGTTVSVGRGTKMPFQVYGSPQLSGQPFSFIPMPSASNKHPKNEGKTCHGKDLRQGPSLSQIDLAPLLEAYKNTADKSSFFNDFFEKLAGNAVLRRQIESGASADEIKASWAPGLAAFRKVREKYLLYP